MKLLIQGGRVIDPSQGLDTIADILIENGTIAAVGANLAAAGAEVVNAKGLVVTPGLVDIHVHLRDPGQEYKEDIVSGTRAAAAGGFTAVACMPNTKPVIDNKAVAGYIINKANTEGTARVFPIGSITKESKGESLAEMGDLLSAGCVGFSDDGRPVSNGDVMRRALEYARPFNAPIICHAEDLAIAAGGVMNEGFVATELGLKGLPWVAEDAMISRDIMLAEFTGAHLHVAHISTKGAVEMVRQAKARGVRVTCEATPHHFTLTEEAVRGYRTEAKMSPPLRTAEDVEAICKGLADGTIDAIATDHAPHHIDEKNVEFNIALNGIVGLESALPLTLALVRDGVISLPRAVELLSTGPSRALNLATGTLKVGAAADVTLIDTEKAFVFTAADLTSKSKNTPFDGWEMQGRAVTTILGGKIVYQLK